MLTPVDRDKWTEREVRLRALLLVAAAEHYRLSKIMRNYYATDHQMKQATVRPAAFRILGGGFESRLVGQRGLYCELSIGRSRCKPGSLTWLSGRSECRNRTRSCTGDAARASFTQHLGSHHPSLYTRSIARPRKRALNESPRQPQLRDALAQSAIAKPLLTKPLTNSTPAPPAESVSTVPRAMPVY